VWQEEKNTIPCDCIGKIRFCATDDEDILVFLLRKSKQITHKYYKYNGQEITPRFITTICTYRMNVCPVIITASTQTETLMI